MLIDGQPAGGASGERLEVFNPATGEVMGAAPVATPAEIDAAVRSASQAFREWRETPAADRAAILMKVVQAVRSRVEDLGQLLTREQGKPFRQAKGEINGFCAVIEFYAQEARRIQGAVLESDQRDRFVYVLRQPVGVVAAIPPWNDPLHLLSRMSGAHMKRSLWWYDKPKEIG